MMDVHKFIAELSVHDIEGLIRIAQEKLDDILDAGRVEIYQVSYSAAGKTHFVYRYDRVEAENEYLKASTKSVYEESANVSLSKVAVFYDQLSLYLGADKANEFIKLKPPILTGKYPYLRDPPPPKENN
ncbi:MAG: hypothetical protein ACRDBQ_23190 [Shewanella sp.]